MAKPIDADVMRAKVAIFADLFRKDRHIKAQADALLAAHAREREHELAEIRQNNERHYRNLANAIPQIVWQAAPDGAIVQFNTQWVSYTGVALDDAHGWKWLNVVHPNDVANCERQWREALATGAVFEVQFRLRRHDGVSRWHLCRAVPERDPAGKLSGWLGTYTDFDDVKRANEAAIEAVRARDEFLAIASHELRTPLATLTLQSEGLLRHVPTLGLEPTASKPLTDRFEAMKRQVTRLEGLVSVLLDVTRITSGQLQFSPERLDLSVLVSGVVERLKLDAERAGSPVALKTSKVVGHWDKLRLEQVTTNLISNAVKYGRGQAINVTLQRERDRAMLTVRDQGIGIAPADCDRIFDRFERAVSAQHYGGLGLGLWITRQIVQAMGGHISVESQVDVGSVFTVDLPCAQ